MARSRACPCSRLFLIFLALTSSYVSENTLGSLRNGFFHTRSNSVGDKGGIPSLKQYVYLWKHVRHLGSFPRGKGYFASRVNYYSNSNCSFHLIRLIVSGDISVNPGPEKCAVCLKTVARNHRALSCDHCDSWCHIKCGDVTPKQYRELQQMDGFSWICPPFLLSVFPFSNTTLNSTINTSIDSFEPDEDVFTALKTTMGNNKNLKIGHININGLVNKLTDIQFLLKEVEFDILGVTETHLTEDISNELIRTHGYNMARRDRSNGLKGGGVVIYCRDNLNIFEDLKWNIHHDFEAAWININSVHVVKQLISLPFYIPQLVKSPPFYIPEA